MKKLWEKIKAWFLQKALPWLKELWLKIKTWFKKNWFMFVNYVVIVLAYNNIYGKEGVVGAEVLLGLWIFASIAYAGWKWFNKKKEKPCECKCPKCGTQFPCKCEK